jgi:hypothetical protein
MAHAEGLAWRPSPDDDAEPSPEDALTDFRLARSLRAAELF